MIKGAFFGFLTAIALGGLSYWRFVWTGGDIMVYRGVLTDPEWWTLQVMAVVPLTLLGAMIGAMPSNKREPE